MNVHSVLSYFRKYESEVRFQQSALDKVRGYNYALETLQQPKRIERDLLQRKLKRILDKVKNKKRGIKIKSVYREDKELKDIISEAIIQKSSEVLQEMLIINDFWTRKNLVKEVQQAMNDTSCYICYPILEKKENRHPLFFIEAQLEHELITIKKVHVNLEALILFIASLNNQEKSEVGIVYRKEIHSILREVDNLEAPATIEEAIESALTIINGKLPDINFTLEGYQEYDGWTCLSTVFITSETLLDLREPPFREEIELVERKLQEPSNNKNPVRTVETLHTYLLGNKQAKSLEVMKDESFFHYGSYTDEYSINKKQWQVIGALNETKLLAVNGPPGTGKTTLLKEIIADELVKKAEKLLEIWDQDWELHEGGKVYISPMNGENQHSVTVTSTNNTAVDNIGKEILAEIPYFHDFVKESTAGNIAGFMCARLGNNDNVQEFKSNVLEPFLKGLQLDNTKYEQTEEQTLHDFEAMLTNLKTTEDLLHQYWKRTNDCLDHQLLDESCSELAVKRAVEFEVENLSNSLNEIKNQIYLVGTNQEKLECSYQRTKKEKDRVQKNIIEIDKQEKEWYEALETYRSFHKTKWLSFLPKRKKFLQQYPSELYIRENIDRIREVNKHKVELLDRHEVTILKMEQEYNNIKHRLQEYYEQVNELEKTIKQKNLVIHLLEQREQAGKILMRQLGVTLPIGERLDQYDLIHATDKVRRQRHALFKQALLVIEHYIWKYRKEIRNNIEYITNSNYLFQRFYSPDQTYDADREKRLRASWETLFLCFPVVTTTLHSFKVHQFQMLEEYIDLLLVDESGQVLPQYLVGPLYRSRRALIVGDVKQIEPVRPTDNSIIEHTAIPEDKQEQYDITKNSAQHFADRHSGVYEKMGNQQVGIILEEHRRCELAIASFSNNYVYDGKLAIVNKNDDNKLFGTNLLGIDVREKETTDNINRQEAVICKQIIQKLVDKYGNEIKKDIGIITPFRQQKVELQKQIKGVSIGTVHTFQGQEKEIIIFSAAVQARSTFFVGAESNLLNVAVTRAKKQFIFVGNFEIIKNSHNYLLDLLETINTYGETFSVYDTENNSKKTRMNQELFQLFAPKTVQPVSSFGQYLHKLFPEHIITGARNHLKVLLQALSKSEKSIEIISPWLNPEFISEDEEGSFKRGIDYVLSRSIDIQILFGYHQNSKASLDNIENIYEADQNGKKEDYIFAVKQLKQQIQAGLIYRPPLHVKVLLVDREYLIIGSHNWLSNRAKQANPKEEMSVILTGKQYIDYVVEHFNL